MKARFLEDHKDVKLPQHNSMFNEIDFESLLLRASRCLDFNVEAARNTQRIGVGEKDKRDLLIYFLWKTGRISNREIGMFFGLTYSAVSRCAKAVNDRIGAEQKLKEKYKKLNSQFKV